MKQINGKKEQIDKMIESYYSYIGYCHTENIIRGLDAKTDEIDQIKIPPNMDEWFEKLSRKHRKQQKLKRLTKNIQKIGKKIAIFMILILTIGTVITCTVEAFRVKILNFFA